jgi:ABC-type transport system involved in cytochrome c biogenesis ATPase subunit
MKLEGIHIRLWQLLSNFYRFRVENVSFNFPDSKNFKNINLNDQGERIFIDRANSSGKTTLTRISGLIQLAMGDLYPR